MSLLFVNKRKLFLRSCPTHKHTHHSFPLWFLNLKNDDINYHLFSKILSPRVLNLWVFIIFSTSLTSPSWIYHTYSVSPLNFPYTVPPSRTFLCIYCPYLYFVIVTCLSLSHLRFYAKSKDYLSLLCLPHSMQCLSLSSCSVNICGLTTHTVHKSLQPLSYHEDSECSFSPPPFPIGLGSV